MSIYDLKAIKMRHEETGYFVIKMTMLEGVGFEISYWHRGIRDAPWVHRYMFTTLAKAEAEYDAALRRLCIAEARMALGIPLE